MKKNLLAFMLCVSVFFVIFACGSISAEEVVLPDGLQYTKYDTYCAITKYSGTDTELIIPSEIEGLPVTAIEEYAFRSCVALKKVDIPSSVNFIGENAFYQCINLTEIKIPEGITSIENNTFALCSGLVKVGLPSTLQRIKLQAFSDCKSLTDIELPEGLKSIEKGAFANCTSLKQINLPGSLELIEEYGFSGCKGLVEITIPSGLKELPPYVFAQCKGLVNVTMSEGLTSIGERAFRSCTALKKVTIPSSVVTIDNEAFYMDSLLKTVDFLGTEEQWNILLANNVYSALNPKVVNFKPAPELVMGGLILESKPDKLRYTIGEKLDTTGLKMKNIVAGVEMDVNSGLVIDASGFDSSKEGVYKIIVAYEYDGKLYANSFNVRVSPSDSPALRAISLATKPGKLVYSLGATLDLTGLSIKVLNLDGTEKIIGLSDDVAVSGYNPETAGIQKLTVTYKGKTTTFSIRVEETRKEVVARSVCLSSKPDKLVYNLGEIFDPKGLSIVAYYPDNSEEIKTVTDGITVSGYDPYTIGVQKLTVTYDGRTTVFSVKVI